MLFAVLCVLVYVRPAAMLADDDVCLFCSFRYNISVTDGQTDRLIDGNNTACIVYRARRSLPFPVYERRRAT